MADVARTHTIHVTGAGVEDKIFTYLNATWGLGITFERGSRLSL